MWPAHIWIDVEDIFAFALSGGRRPTGIQRLAYELCKAMVARDPERVRFVRHDRLRDSFAVIPWSDLDTLFTGLTEPATAARKPARPARRVEGWLRGLVRPLAGRLPREVRAPLGRMLTAQFQAVLAAAAVARVTAQLIGRRLRRRRDRGHIGTAADAAGFACTVAPGDLLFAPGAAYFHPFYPQLIARMRRDHGMRVAVLLYDIIPVRRPEYVDRFHATSFGAWLDGTLPLCDVLLAISRSAADEVEDHARRHGIPLRTRVQPIPIGTGFSAAPAEATPAQIAALPAPGSYVLFVSTLEARKNHLLLFRVWRRLIEAMPADEVPTLVFAGRVGWMVADFMLQLENSDFLGGKVRLIDQPTDGELAALYRGCLFTLFPSFYEGWGLPVTESLSFGKPCIISNATSLPEAGGALARYFDPEDVLGATALIRATLEDRPGLAAWTAQVATSFTPVPWDETARTVLEGLA